MTTAYKFREAFGRKNEYRKNVDVNNNEGWMMCKCDFQFPITSAILSKQTMACFITKQCHLIVDINYRNRRHCLVFTISKSEVTVHLLKHKSKRIEECFTMAAKNLSFVQIFWHGYFLLHRGQQLQLSGHKKIHCLLIMLKVICSIKIDQCSYCKHYCTPA